MSTETNIATGEALATSVAAVAGVATGNPAIVPITIASEALLNAIMNIQQASSAKGTMTTAELDAQWTANAKAMGVALSEFMKAK